MPAAFFVAGLVLGALHYGSLRWNLALDGRRGPGGRPVVPAALLHVLRFGLLVAVLATAAFQGAIPLLMIAAGLVLARPLAVRWWGVAR